MSAINLVQLFATNDIGLAKNRNLRGICVIHVYSDSLKHPCKQSCTGFRFNLFGLMGTIINNTETIFNIISVDSDLSAVFK